MSTDPARNLPTTMRAAVRYRYGGSAAIEITEAPVPAVGPGTVLVEVAAAALNPLDWHMLTGTPWLVRLQAGLRRPKSPGIGADLAGVVVAVGSEVTGFAPGDEVVGFAHGALAEYVVARPERLTAKPAGIAFDEIAGLPVAGVTALQGLRDHAGLTSGQRVLVNGAAGGVGTAAVQLAASMGAEVTAVCSTRNVDLVRSLGATRIIDYTAEDFAEIGTNTRYDIIFDNQGNRSPGTFVRLLTDDGTYLMVGGPKNNRVFGPIGQMIRTHLRFAVTSKRARSFIAKETAADIAHLVELVDAGRLRTVVSDVRDLDRLAGSIDELAAGHIRGKLIINP